MNTNIRTLATENYIESKYNLKYFDQDVLDLTGSIRTAQVYAAIRFDFKTHIWAHHKAEVIANDHWFYIRRDYLAQFCKVPENLISKCVKILVEHGLLETKVTNQGYKKGKTTYYRFSVMVLRAGGNSLTTVNWSKNSSAFYALEQNTTDDNGDSKNDTKNSSAFYALEFAPDDMTENPDTPLIDEPSSRARENTYNKNENIINKKNTYGCASTSHCASSPKNSKSGGVLLTVPNYSKNDMKCAQFCFETICKNFPKSNAAKAGWDSLRDEWSATIDKLAKKFTEGDNKRVQAALKWAFGPRNRRNSFLQENIRSLPMLLTKKWKTSDEMEYTFDRLLRDFDADTRIDTEDSLDAKLRTACEKALAEYEQPDYDVDSIMSWIEYLQDEIDKLNNMLPPDKRSSWHRGNGMVKLVQWIIDILEQFEGCSMYDDADSYVDRFFQITQDKIRAGKLKFIWPGYFTDDNGGYVPFERQVMDFYPKIFG